ncbi:uncharacterized protein LOC106880251 isoform X3 [Octopus bimaculoides]|uniref:uncharacterized protein LOC106880251 isoform X3 n=1 Tax=Octopus bimaculoides TaxID=37653 RepID=UPI0022E93521|nr:uncharacterized protein LOC106880251 isoform X3 [Octopus bimaculoides]
MLLVKLFCLLLAASCCHSTPSANSSLQNVFKLSDDVGPLNAVFAHAKPEAEIYPGIDGHLHHLRNIKRSASNNQSAACCEITSYHSELLSASTRTGQSVTIHKTNDLVQRMFIKYCSAVSVNKACKYIRNGLSSKCVQLHIQQHAIVKLSGDPKMYYTFIEVPSGCDCQVVQ